MMKWFTIILKERRSIIIKETIHNSIQVPLAWLLTFPINLVNKMRTGEDHKTLNSNVISTEDDVPSVVYKTTINHHILLRDCSSVYLVIVFSMRISPNYYIYHIIWYIRNKPISSYLVLYCSKFITNHVEVHTIKIVKVHVTTHVLTYWTTALGWNGWMVIKCL